MSNPFEILEQKISEINENQKLILQLLTQSTQEPAPENMDVTQAAKFTNYTPKTLYDMVHKGKIPFHKPAGKLIFKRTELENFIKAGRKATRQERIDALLA